MTTTIPSDGYSGTPLARKLGIAAAACVLRINAPVDYEARLAPSPHAVVFTDVADRKIELAHVFVTEQKVLVKQLKALRSKLRPEGTITGP